MSQQQQQDDTRLPQPQPQSQQDSVNAPTTTRPIVPPYNPQNRTDAASPTSKTFMDYLKEYWWIVVVVLALIAFLIYWFCFRKPSKGKAPGEPVLLGGNNDSGGNTHAVSGSNSGSGSGSGSRSGRSSNGSNSNGNGNSGNGSNSGNPAPKLNITSQRLSN